MFILTVMEDMVKINPDQFDREFTEVSAQIFSGFCNPFIYCA
jgi:DNA-directed RNA polymerase subunit E'/Rpb7